MKLLLYCTKAKPYIMKYNDGKYKEIASFYNKQDLAIYDLLNGKIVAECDFEVEEIKYRYDTSAYRYNNINDYYYTNTLNFTQLEKRSCLTNKDLLNYLGQNAGYAIHIKNLHIFDEPRELEQLETCDYKAIKKAPQNMMKCMVLKNDEHYDEYILISIKPEWLCKILNGEKAIEVRKKVLKEMLK